MNENPETLVGLSEEELAALAANLLVPAGHVRLNELLQRNAAGLLTIKEQLELDSLLRRVDQLTILKARAQFTLFQRADSHSEFRAS